MRDRMVLHNPAKSTEIELFHICRQGSEPQWQMHEAYQPYQRNCQPETPKRNAACQGEIHRIYGTLAERPRSDPSASQHVDLPL